MPEELSVEVALEFGLEFNLDSKASLDQPSESSPDSNVLSELLNRFRPPFKCTLIVGSFRRTLLLVGISLSFVTVLDTLFGCIGLHEFDSIFNLSSSLNLVSNVKRRNILVSKKLLRVVVDQLSVDKNVHVMSTDHVDLEKL